MNKLSAALLAALLLPMLLASCHSETPDRPAVTDTSQQQQQESDEPETDDTTDYDRLSALPFEGLAESPAAAFTVSETNGEVTVTGYTGTETKVRVPSHIDGKPVTAIGNGAFRGHSEITVLFLPDGIASFGTNVLTGCSNLYALRTPFPTGEGAGYLGYLFGASGYETNNVADMRNLEFLELGGGLTELPAYALYDCNDLVCIRLSESITALGDFSLYRCEALKYVNSEHLQRIGMHAMDSCISLEELTLGASLKEIGLGALENCSSMRRLTLPFVGGSADRNRYLGYLFGAEDSAFSNGFYPHSLRSVTVLPGCTSIDAYAFYECDSLRTVSLPDGIASVGVRAFSGCTSLRELVLPDSVQIIRESAFFGCSALAVLRLGNGLTSIGVNAFYRCSALTEVILPQALTELPNSCFADCTSLQTVQLGGVSSVGIRAFYRCDALTSVSATGKVRFESGNELAQELLNR